MPDVWVTVAVAAALLGVGFVMLSRRQGGGPVVDFADPREERLARRLAGAVGCTPAQALPAVRREIDIAPGQSDETLLKRAVYHYRQDLPEKTCSVYRDRAPG